MFFLTRSNLWQDHSFSKLGGLILAATSWLPWVFDPALTPRCCWGGWKLDHLLQEVHHALLELQTLELQEALLLQGPMDFPAGFLYGPTGPLLLLQHGLHQPQLLLLHGQLFTGLSSPGWRRMRAEGGGHKVKYKVTGNWCFILVTLLICDPLGKHWENIKS